MESVVYADSPVEEILRDSGVAVEEIAAVEGGEAETETETDAEDSETLYLPGSFHIDTANIQFSLISSYLLSDAIESRRSDADSISSVYSTYSVYVQLSALSIALLSAPVPFLVAALALSAISTLTTSSARTQSLAYLQLTQALCEQCDARIAALLTTHRLTTHTKIHIYDAMRRLQNAYTDAARDLHSLVDDKEHKALQAMYVRDRDTINASAATRDAHSKAHAHHSWSPALVSPHSTHTHRRNHTWPSPIPVPNTTTTAAASTSASTNTTPRTSPTITYIQSPVNRSSRARRSGGSVSSVGSRRSTMNGVVEQGGARSNSSASASVGNVAPPVHSLAPLTHATQATQVTPGTRARARSYVQPIQAPQPSAHSHAHPDKSIRQRAVSQQHLRLPSLLRTNNAPAPILMRNSFGTPIGHISPTPSPTPSRKASLAGVDVERDESEDKRDKEEEETSTTNPGDSLGLTKNADGPVEQEQAQEQEQDKADTTSDPTSQTSQSPQTSQTSTTPQSNTIKPSDIAQRRSKPIISKTRLWELRQEVHDTRKPAIVAIIALKYGCKAEVYWKSVRGVVRELARSLRKVDGELSGRSGENVSVEGVEGGVGDDTHRKCDQLSTHTHTTLRHLEHAYDVLFECYALNQYTRYADAHAHLSDALKAYSVGVATGAASGTDMGMAGSTRRRKKEREVPSEEVRAARAVDGIDAKTTADSSLKTHYQDDNDNDNEKTQSSAQDDATAYLLDQTSAASLPRRGRRCDEAVFDGDTVENDAGDEDDADVFAPPDIPDREARLAGKEVLDELMGLLRGEDGVDDEETRSARAVSPTPLPPPPQPQWRRRSDVGDIPQDAHVASDRNADADKDPDSDSDSDTDTDVVNDDHSPQAAREAAQRALKSIVF